jgi:glutamine amidotransferase-like uncharacterized protein
MNRYKIILTVISVISLLLVCTFNMGNPLVSSIQKNGTNNSVVKVLIYDGDGTMESSVEGIKKELNESNNMNLIPNNHFEYFTSSIINSNTLLGYDVLIIPGGDASTYIENENIDSDSIKQFINGGNGYLGICAGAYAASNSVDGYYSGWGITPDVNTKNVEYEGSLSIKATSFGNNIINSTLNDIHMENGPALYSNNSQIVMAEYADNKTGYQNFAAIVGESSGSGRVILSGPHPEIDAQNPQLLAYMVLWVSSRI